MTSQCTHVIQCTPNLLFPVSIVFLKNFALTRVGPCHQTFHFDKERANTLVLLYNRIHRVDAMAVDEVEELVSVHKVVCRGLFDEHRGSNRLNCVKYICRVFLDLIYNRGELVQLLRASRIKIWDAEGIPVQSSEPGFQDPLQLANVAQ